MKKFDKDLIKSFNISPYDGEFKEVFIKRFVRNFDVRGAIRNKLDRILMAQTLWDNWKLKSLVSIKTDEEEYLLFGDILDY